MNHTILRSLARTFRLHQKTAQLQANLWQVWSGLLLNALTEEELSILSGHTYDLSPLYRSDVINEWESRWWSESLPNAPAKVLLGACGAGREVVWLLEQGYEVTAFEPAATMVALAQHRAQSGGTIYQSDYQAFVRNPPRQDFDGIIFGWGSFSHVLDEELQNQLLSTAVRMCPDGPLLLSWLPASQGVSRSRARTMGENLAMPFKKLRGLSVAGNSSHEILPWAGPIRTFSRADIQRMASSVGREAHFGPENEYPHATLI